MRRPGYILLASSSLFVIVDPLAAVPAWFNWQKPIESLILALRGQRVILDADLAKLYGVPTKRLNEQVKRNAERFPDDFCFQLTLEEAEAVRRSRSQIVTLKRGQNIKYLPRAFTEHGAIMAASILNSPQAVLITLTSLFFCVCQDSNPSGFRLKSKLPPQRHSAA
jgi:hypothetical protein